MIIAKLKGGTLLAQKDELRGCPHVKICNTIADEFIADEIISDDFIAFSQ